jgi:hypothetical protein
VFFSVLPISLNLFEHSNRVFPVFTQFPIAYAVCLCAIPVPTLAVTPGPSAADYTLSHSASP